MTVVGGTRRAHDLLFTIERSAPAGGTERREEQKWFEL